MSLDEYRRSFKAAYETVVQTIRGQLGHEVFGRPAESTGAISEKLQRESIRLTQIQDIAGCRVIVSDALSQNQVVDSLKNLFVGANIKDRRTDPSYGYRAVHLIATVSDKVIEIQVRTSLQHAWAELSEKYSDVINRSIKYGGGPEIVRKILADISTQVTTIESLEDALHKTRLLDRDGIYSEDLRKINEQLIEVKKKVAYRCDELMTWLKQQGKQ